MAGPATELIGNLLVKPLAGGRITCPGTEECLRENKNLLSSGFLAMREIELWSCWWWGSGVDSIKQERRELNKIYSGVLLP